MGGLDGHRRPTLEAGLTPVLPSLGSTRRTSTKTRRSVVSRGGSGRRGGSKSAVNELDALKQALVDDVGDLNARAPLTLIYTWMKSHCTKTNIFASSHEYVSREICRHMRLIKLPSGAMLIRQGDVGDRCYIIIDGTVDVFIRQDAAFQGFSEEAETQYRLVSPKLNIGTIMTTLTPGSIVGEVVLSPSAVPGPLNDVVANPSIRRTATVVVSKDTPECCVIFLGRADYIRLVRNVSMEASHFVQAEVLDFMVVFQRWPKQGAPPAAAGLIAATDKMKCAAQMKSVHFRANVRAPLLARTHAAQDYLYKAGTITKVMYIIVLGEAVEKYNLNVVQTHGPSSATGAKTKSEIKVNIELLLLGPGEVANEFAFFRPSMIGHFDIKAVTEVHALAIDKRLFEAMTAPSDYAHDFVAKLTSMSSDREDWRKERIEFGSRYPDAHIVMTWNLLRMGNLRCSRCGKRGHLPADLGRCHHSKKTDWPLVQQRIDKLLNPQPARTTLSTSADSPRYKRRSIYQASTTKDVHREALDESCLPSAKEQLDVAWRLRRLAFPGHISDALPPTNSHAT
ncbi:hypothetical protein ACHHYP_01674 [Achlya hypogyna]|uniref:Cyclic nucleotide-binding domain-containing protein n=1 Tax=Achlya hypogyna TaxID=1202772 RepID=A0A1V9Z823_ACHHY|nr:hypothetical protein ACHHYP_01674 [Achlya hypogyna]